MNLNKNVVSIYIYVYHRDFEDDLFNTWNSTAFTCLFSLLNFEFTSFPCCCWCFDWCVSCTWHPTVLFNLWTPHSAHTHGVYMCVCVHALSWVRMKERQRKKNVSQWVPCQWLMAYRRLMNWIEYYYHIWVSCEYGLLWKWKSWINHEHLFHIFYSSFLYLYAHT